MKVSNRRAAFLDFFRKFYGIIAGFFMAIFLVVGLSNHLNPLRAGGIFVLILVFALAVFFSKKLFSNGVSKKVKISIILVLTSIALILQGVVSSSVTSKDFWDAGIVSDIAMHYIENGNSRMPGHHRDYLVIYGGNIPITSLLVRIYQFAISNGFKPYQFGILVNNFLVGGASLLILYSIFRLFGFRGYLLSWPFVLLFVNLNVFSAVLYTDTTGLFFISLALALLVSLRLAKEKWSQIILALLLGGVLFASGNYKITAYILLIALVLVAWLAVRKGEVVRNLVLASCVVAGFLGGKILYDFEISKMPNFTSFSKEEIEQKTVGLSHYLGMGALRNHPKFKGCKDGNFCMSYILESYSKKSQKERNEFAMEIFAKSVKDDFPHGYVGHAVSKVRNIFKDGTFGVWVEASGYNDRLKFFRNDDQAVKIREYFGPFNNGYFEKVANVFWGASLVLMLIFAVSIIFRKDSAFEIWLAVIFDGVVFYQILFENRARYIFLFLPIFITMSILGIIKMSAFFTSIRKVCYNEKV